MKLMKGLLLLQKRESSRTMTIRKILQALAEALEDRMIVMKALVARNLEN
jgi:hypothetical protein